MPHFLELSIRHQRAYVARMLAFSPNPDDWDDTLIDNIVRRCHEAAEKSLKDDVREVLANRSVQAGRRWAK